MEDADTTAKRQQEAVAQVPPVLDLDEEAAEHINERLHRAMAFMREQLRLLGAPGSAGSAYQELLESLKPEFDRLLGVSLPGPTFLLLARSDFSPNLEALAKRLVEEFCRQGSSVPGLCPPRSPRRSPCAGCPPARSSCSPRLSLCGGGQPAPAGSQGLPGDRREHLPGGSLAGV